jgi:RNA-dependent RNA polymerase
VLPQWVNINSVPCFADFQQTPWKEMDREEAELASAGENHYLLTHDPIQGSWFGGKIKMRAQIKAKLVKKSTWMPYVSLQQCEVGTSCRFSRAFGSLSFLYVSISSSARKVSPLQLIAFLKIPFVLWGAVFRVFYASRDGATFFRTDEAYVNRKIQSGFYPSRLSLVQFLSWHNPLELNKDQVSQNKALETTETSLILEYDKMGISDGTWIIHVCSRNPAEQLTNSSRYRHW